MCCCANVTPTTNVAAIKTGMIASVFVLFMFVFNQTLSSNLTCASYYCLLLLTYLVVFPTDLFDITIIVTKLGEHNYISINNNIIFRKGYDKKIIPIIIENYICDKFQLRYTRIDNNSSSRYFRNTLVKKKQS